MYKGKFAKRSRRRAGRSVALLVSLALLLTAAVAGTVALLIDTSGNVANTFEPAFVKTEVIEKFENNQKANVQIKNTGNIDAYIRAAVVVNWQDKDGNVYPKAPVAGPDYEIQFVTTAQTNGQWFEHSDGFYYWNKAVAPSKTTDILIKSCVPVAENTPAGYYLCVEILSSGIQSVGVNENDVQAVQDAWKVTISNGTVSTYTAGN